ncbi:transposase [Mycolicibacterium farcinogenes]|uniref:Transposase n=1 Tax=Mycolicibacterium farcinogenes TaxID=1802 RepID=A0ACD1FQW2_MYCFR|nr:transposase [Mycolicibacterium farcinogenes]QZH69432.1 transposase [Mycolicibacterium farcinogenes]
MTRKPPPPPTEQALRALAKHRKTVSDDKRRDIEKALAYLRKTNATINVSTVSRRAKVTRKTIHKHKDLLAVIDQYRHHPSTAEPPQPGRDTTIVAAMRRKIAAQDSEIRELKATIAHHVTTIELLHGQLDDARLDHGT